MLLLAFRDFGGHPFVQSFGVRFVRDWMDRVGGERKFMTVPVLPLFFRGCIYSCLGSAHKISFVYA